MKSALFAVCAALAAAAPAFAQDNSDSSYPYNAERVERQQWREARERELRNDYGTWEERRAREQWRREKEWLDRRALDERFRDERWRDFASSDRDWQCLNRHAGVYEDVRKGEFQDDLDYTRCRVVGERYRYGWR